VASNLISPTPATASAALDQTTVIICTSLKTGYQLISKTGKCNERIYEARTWFQKGSAPSGTPESKPIDLVTCTSRTSTLQIIRTRSACNSKTQTTSLWQRPLGAAVAPSITSVVMGLLGTSTLNIAAPMEDGGARITSYLVTSSPAAVAATFTPAQIKAAKITGLTPGITYSFSVVAINSKGSSPSSIASAPALAPTIPNVPGITKVVATGTNSAQLTFTAPLDNGGSPVTSYVATSLPNGFQTTVYQSAGGTINITNLLHSTTYTFTLTAINAAGSSLASAISASVTTATPPPPPEPVAAAPALAAPAFTLSASSETRTVDTAATGFTISSTGGAIASFAISATPAGMSFSTSTGALSGTPNTVASATTYTITTTNASGSATQTFTLTVITAVPAFTLSSSSETRTVNTAATGFTISSTGGAIASFAISATPAGMSFSTSTGALTGTPTSVAGATAYTITATNASGSATRTFTLTITAPIVISLAAIAGVTAPVTGATPVSTTTAGTGYTGTVSWSGTPTTFSEATIYTATITLTAAAGYTLTGVTENFFTVAGATPVTHSANLGVITAVFYLVGATGPGGGKIFYVATTPFACGPTLAATCTYLEAAPENWMVGGSPEPTKTWATNVTSNQTTAVAGADGTFIGTGYKNSLDIAAQIGNEAATSAAVLARSYTSIRLGVNYTDWYLPSKDELNQMCKWARGITGVDLINVLTLCIGGTINTGSGAAGFVSGRYWSSSQYDAKNAWHQYFDTTSQSSAEKWETFYVRPVRAF